MKKNYHHIKKAERLEIAILLKRGYSMREAANALCRNPGTISRELKRNSTNQKYDPHKANHKAYVKRKYSKYEGMKIARDNKYKRLCRREDRARLVPRRDRWQTKEY